METDAQRREILLGMLAQAWSTIAVTSCKNTITGTDEKSPERDEEGGNGDEGGGY